MTLLKADSLKQIFKQYMLSIWDIAVLVLYNEQN